MTRSCRIRKGYGFYRRYRIIWYVIKNCRCRKRRRFTCRLCRCRRNYVRKYCSGSKIIHKRFSFFRKFNWCFRRVRKTCTPIICLLPRASLRVSACRRVTPRGRCVRSIAITERRVRNCVCVDRRRTFTQICCAPRSSVRTYCNSKKGFRVTVRTVYFLTTVGVFYNQDGVFVRRRAVRSQKIITRLRIVCQASRRRVECNVRTGVKKITWFNIRRDGCNCVQSIRVTKGRCSKF